MTQVLHTNNLKNTTLTQQKTIIYADAGPVNIDSVHYKELVIRQVLREGQPALVTFHDNKFKGYTFHGFRVVAIFGTNTTFDGDVINGSSEPALLLISDGMKVTGAFKNWDKVKIIPQTETCEHHPVADRLLEEYKRLFAKLDKVFLKQPQPGNNQKR